MKKTIVSSFTIVVAVVLVGSTVFSVFLYEPKQSLAATPATVQGDASGTKLKECKEVTVHVHGTSLVPLLKDGAEIIGHVGDCGHFLQRGDLVLVHYAVKRLDPLVKVIFGIPGDTFGFKETKDGWNLLINGAVAKNSTGMPYVLSVRGHNMLSLYEHDYHGIIPTDAYLIFGDNPFGSIDSTVFGLVGRSDIIGFTERP